MGKSKDMTLAELAALLVPSKAITPKPKREGKKMTEEAKAKRDWYRELGMHAAKAPSNMRPRGRPVGSKDSKPRVKKSGYATWVELNHTNATQFFLMYNGTIRRITAGKMGEVAHRLRRGSTRMDKGWAPYVVRFKNTYYSALEVAWWLVHGTEVPEGMKVMCSDLRRPPQYTAETLYLATHDAIY